MSAIEFKKLRGAELRPWVESLGQVRIDVFREFPYLYDGDLGYEKSYLSMYAQAQDSFVCLALDQEKVVGGTTAIPLKLAEAEFQQPFVGTKFAVDEICYFGESILLPTYRGKGLGKLFFQERESYACSLDGIKFCAFCAVQRDEQDPRRPPDYQPLNSFWEKQGYRCYPEIQAKFPWKEVGSDGEQLHTLKFWLKELV